MNSNFRRYFDAPIVPISLKFRVKFRLRKRNFARNFVWESEISRNSLFGERNFVHHFLWRSEISRNISFVGVEITLNVDEINKSCE